MFIKIEENLDWTNNYVACSEITADDVVVLDEEIDEGPHRDNFFKITKSELDVFASNSQARCAEDLTDEESTKLDGVWENLCVGWRERGLLEGPIFGARVIRNNQMHDIDLDA